MRQQYRATGTFHHHCHHSTIIVITYINPVDLMSGCHTLVRTTAAGAPGIACVSRIAPPVGVTMVMEASLQRAASTSRGQNPCCSRRPAAHKRFNSQLVLSAVSVEWCDHCE